MTLYEKMQEFGEEQKAAGKAEGKAEGIQQERDARLADIIAIMREDGNSLEAVLQRIRRMECYKEISEDEVARLYEKL